MATSFKSTPLANDFIPSNLLSKKQDIYPLGLMFCNSCAHHQLSHVVNPDLMFEHYVYVSSTSQTFVKHFENYKTAVLQNYSPSKNALIVDIGSNDGILLDFFKRDGFNVLGIDPATNLAMQANTMGIETINRFFTSKLVEEIVTNYGQASIVLANNVFAHIDDLSDVTKGIYNLLSDDGVFIFEVSYLKQVIENNLFDTIYHEHLSYHTLTPLLTFFNNHAMDIIDCEEIDTHGGSIRVTVQKKDGPYIRKTSVTKIIADECALGFNTINPINTLTDKITYLKKELTALVDTIKSSGANLIGYGAPAKATTLLYEFGLSDQLEYIIDDNPLKQGLYTPGSHIPVISPDVLMKGDLPSYMIVLAWNFANQIMEQHRYYLNQGGHFIVPLPNLKVY